MRARPARPGLACGRARLFCSNQVKGLYVGDAVLITPCDVRGPSEGSEDGARTSHARRRGPTTTARWLVRPRRAVRPGPGRDTSGSSNLFDPRMYPPTPVHA